MLSADHRVIKTMGKAPGITPLLVGRSLNRDKMDKTKLDIMSRKGLKAIAENTDEQAEDGGLPAPKKSSFKPKRVKNTMKNLRNFE